MHLFPNTKCTSLFWHAEILGLLYSDAHLQHTIMYQEPQILSYTLEYSYANKNKPILAIFQYRNAVWRGIFGSFAKSVAYKSIIYQACSTGNRMSYIDTKLSKMIEFCFKYTCMHFYPNTKCTSIYKCMHFNARGYGTFLLPLHSQSIGTMYVNG